jgi:DNA-binding cell septation regulator SpoVG
MPDGTDPNQFRAMIVDRLDGWRRRAAHPLNSSDRHEACELVAAAYERLHADVATD